MYVLSPAHGSRHSNLIDPFREILKEKNSWEWGDVHSKAFEDMKMAFVNCVELSHYIPGEPYRLPTDAFRCGDKWSIVSN